MIDSGLVIVGTIIIIACVIIVVAYCTSDKGPYNPVSSGVVELRANSDSYDGKIASIFVYGDNEAQVNEVYRKFISKGYIAIPRIFKNNSHLSDEFPWFEGVNKYIKDFDILDKCGMLYIVDKDGSISKDCCAVMAYAYHINKPIIRYNCKLPESLYAGKTVGYDDLWLPMLGDNR